MVGCILTGHGTFAEGLGGALEMVGGPQEFFQAVSFHEDEAATFGDKLAGAISEMLSACDGVVVFCDLMGGTPFNQAMMAASVTPGVEVVTGTNLPMLLETLSTRMPDSTVEELVECALASGKMGVDHKKLEIADDSDDDGLLGEEDGL